jgi:hypothetical protein
VRAKHRIEIKKGGSGGACFKGSIKIERSAEGEADKARCATVEAPAADRRSRVARGVELG